MKMPDDKRNLKEARRYSITVRVMKCESCGAEYELKDGEKYPDRCTLIHYVGTPTKRDFDYWNQNRCELR